MGEMNEKIYNLTIRVKITDQKVTFFQTRWKSNQDKTLNFPWNLKKYYTHLVGT